MAPVHKQTHTHIPLTHTDTRRQFYTTRNTHAQFSHTHFSHTRARAHHAHRHRLTSHTHHTRARTHHAHRHRLTSHTHHTRARTHPTHSHAHTHPTHARTLPSHTRTHTSLTHAHTPAQLDADEARYLLSLFARPTRSSPFTFRNERYVPARVDDSAIYAATVSTAHACARLGDNESTLGSGVAVPSGGLFFRSLTPPGDGTTTSTQLASRFQHLQDTGQLLLRPRSI